MRDAIGQVFTLQIILAFVLLINGYMAYSVNYARAFQVKNHIVDIIEEYEGYENNAAQDKINAYIEQVNYNVPNRMMTDFIGKNGGECPGWNGWCVVTHDVTMAGGDSDINGNYYTVVSFVSIDIPVINNIIGLGEFLQVRGETRTIY